MKNAITFLAFLAYATLIFFMPNNIWLASFAVVNLILMLIIKVNFKKAIINLTKYLPFILFTFIFNILLDNYINAIWMAVKLLLVCNATYIYSRTITVAQLAKTVRTICKPLEVFKINTEEIEVLVSIALSMIPVLKKEYREVKEACKAKNINFNIKNMKIILSKILLSTIKRINEIDESLVEKGYEY